MIDLRYLPNAPEGYIFCTNYSNSEVKSELEAIIKAAKFINVPVDDIIALKGLTPDYNMWSCFVIKDHKSLVEAKIKLLEMYEDIFTKYLKF